MKLLLVRHGQTLENYLKRIQGKTDNPLNATGIKQAQELGKYFKKENFFFDIAYSSPLSRALKTAEIALSYLDYQKEIITDSRFEERNFGPLENKEITQTLLNQIRNNVSGLGYETDEALAKRVYEGLLDIYRKHKGKRVVIFCHSHVIKAFLILADKNTYSFHTFLENASAHELTFDGKDLNVINFNLVSE